MNRLMMLALLGSICFAEGAPRPRCEARNQGEFWPPEANGDKAAARELLQRGELEMCSRTLWKYRWEPLSVNVRDLGKKRGSSDAPAKPVPATPSSDGTANQ